MEDNSIEVSSTIKSATSSSKDAVMKNEPCPFCAIVSNHLKAQVIFDWENTMAILDHRPIAEGHCLVIPKLHLVDVTDIPTLLGGEIQALISTVVKSQRAALGTPGAMVMNNNVVSQHVKHFHAHVIPRRIGDGISILAKNRPRQGTAHLEEVSAKLRSQI